MARLLKLILLAGGGLFGVLLLAAVAVVLTHVPDVKRQAQALVSEALGMEVAVGGELHFRLFPSLHVTMQNVLIRNHGSEIASAAQVGVGIELLPLLRREVRMGAVALKHVKISLERRRDGRFNFETSRQRQGTLPLIDVSKVSLADATLVYTDQQSDRGFEASACELDVRRLQLQSANQKRPTILSGLSFNARLACDEIRTRDLFLADVKSSIESKAGVFDFKPVTLRVFGGEGEGDIQADFSGAVPQYQVRYSLSQFRFAEFCRTLSQKSVGDGPMDFSANLRMAGTTVAEMMRSAAGEASIHGDDLTLEIGDIDKQLSRFESSQRFNLIDAGAFFLAGPIGPAVTKGYNFASIFVGTGGSSQIRTLVSEWNIERGMAQAKDVAMTTKNHRIALKGGLNLVDGRFDEVTVAVVDAQGCSNVQQVIRGPFEKPEIQKPSVLKSLSGPARTLLGQAKSLFGRKCSVFYAGAVEPPGPV
jgi:uncharacterized protein involved in outer membrane biogenesis